MANSISFCMSRLMKLILLVKKSFQLFEIKLIYENVIPALKRLY